MIEVVVGDDILACLCCMTSQRKNRQAIAVAVPNVVSKHSDMSTT